MVDGYESDKLVVEGLWKRFRSRTGRSTVALANVNLRVGQGDFLALLGPSGCGKTTLLRLLAGLDEASAGHIRINGKDVKGPSESMAFVFQSAVLLPWRTVLQNVMLPVRVRRLKGAEWEERAATLLRTTGLSDFTDHYPRELSGGMRQRAAICRALLLDPEVLLMDEPFGALDAITRETMNEELFNIWRETGKTVVFVTHDIAEAARLATRVAIMSSRPGRITAMLEMNLDTENFARRVQSTAYFERVKELTSYVAPHRDVTSEVSA